MGFWRDLAERAVRTAAQTALAVWGTDATGVMVVGWQGGLTAVGIAVLGSVLTSLAATRWGDDVDSASFQYVGKHAG